MAFVYDEIFLFVSAKKQSKPYKPLASKKFYLDLKNNATLLNLETKLKSLGAVSNHFCFIMNASYSKRVV